MYRFVLLLFLLFTVCGCQKSDDPRVHLSGQVTWNGNPVPAGHVLLSPDAAKGNSGAQGMAAIRDGHYDTSATGGRPAMPGSVTVTIHAFDGKSSSNDSPNGTRLFMPYDMDIEVPSESGEFDLAIPDDVEPVPKE